MELFKGKVVCPMCHGNGLIFKAKIKNEETILYICDECDATWEHDNAIQISNFIELSSLLKKSNSVYSDILNLGYDWYND
ncbi:3'-5' exonuclease [Bacillus cereus]|uniref:3'-5' exonuclease n=1 Tax=Bacillus cereus group TaxID=86661 RepID=UPI001F55F222